MGENSHKSGPDPHDLDTLQGSVNDSAGQAVVLWSSFTLFGLYLSIAAGSVTHRDLFLDRPIKLPVLDVDLPVDGFFAIAPIVYLIFHAYLLLQLVRLASKLAAWRAELVETVTDPVGQRLLLLRFNDFPFLQFLADRDGKRLGASRLVLLSISWITLTLFPVLLLLRCNSSSCPTTWPPSPGFSAAR